MTDQDTPSIDVSQVRQFLADEPSENCPPDVDPLDEDAPIHQLLSVMHNPRVKDMSTDQLNALITKLRANATSPQTLTATLQRESRKRPMTEAQRKRKELLDSL